MVSLLLPVLRGNYKPASTFLSYPFRRTMLELFELEIKFLRYSPSLASGLATS